MIIKDINSDMLYVLGHLSDFCGMKLGTPVSPGQFVAKVGNTGKSSGPHLHLEARVCNGRTEMQNVLVKDSNNSYGNGPGLAFRADGQYSFPKEVNPFDFSIPLKQQKTDLR
jgi:murein DD-endopeptidase MepM/ murein hydrolase activator NlpD